MSMMKRERRAPELAWPETRIDQVFRSMLRDFFSGGIMPGWFTWSSNVVHLEEYMEDGTFVIRAELPGLDPDKDIQLEVGSGMLHLTARREERKEEERPSGYRTEFRYGSFERVIRLPEGASEADVTASYQNGILEIRVPVPTVEEKAPTKVPIERS